MSHMLPRVAARLFDTPLMVAPEKAVSMLYGLGSRIVGGNLVIQGDVEPVDHMAYQNGRLHMGTVGQPMARRIAARGQRPYDVFENVAVISIEGTLVHKGAFIGQSSGETSYEGLQAQVMTAAQDPMVKGVAYEIDSFGGEVSGAFETAELMRRLSEIKPTMAILTDHAASSGYLLASPQRQIVGPKTGGSGSIGVMAIHRDVSKKMENEGVVVTLISSGAHKVDMSPFKPLDTDVAKRIQALCDTQRDMFAATVGRHRGSRLTKAAALATEASMFFGEEGLKAGLIDAVADPNDAFAAFLKAVNRA